jgi:hypothetical protein
MRPSGEPAAQAPGWEFRKDLPGKPVTSGSPEQSGAAPATVSESSVIPPPPGREPLRRRAREGDAAGSLSRS